MAQPSRMRTSRFQQQGTTQPHLCHLLLQGFCLCLCLCFCFETRFVYRPGYPETYYVGQVASNSQSLPVSASPVFRLKEHRPLPFSASFFFLFVLNEQFFVCLFVFHNLWASVPAVVFAVWGPIQGMSCFPHFPQLEIKDYLLHGVLKSCNEIVKCWDARGRRVTFLQ